VLAQRLFRFAGPPAKQNYQQDDQHDESHSARVLSPAILYGHAGSAPITIISRITKQNKTHSLIFLILSAALQARVD
jgi:hypothetical protein